MGIILACTAGAVIGLWLVFLGLAFFSELTADEGKLREQGPRPAPVFRNYIKGASWTDSVILALTFPGALLGHWLEVRRYKRFVTLNS